MPASVRASVPARRAGGYTRGVDELEKIAERKLAEAAQAGAFDDLPGFGRPLPEEPDYHGPAELRTAWRLLRSAGALPEEVDAWREVRTLEGLLRGCLSPAAERAALERELSTARVKLALALERAGARIPAEYEARLLRSAESSALERAEAEPSAASKATQPPHEPR